MIPRHGRPARPGTIYRRRPGAYAILPRGGRLLLTVQMTASGPEVQLPGGGIDPDEHSGPALAREIFEETGHSAIIGRRIGTFREFIWMPEYGIEAEKICHVHLCRPGLRQGPPREPGHSVLWLCPDAAMDALASSGGRAMLASWLRPGGCVGGGIGDRRIRSG